MPKLLVCLSALAIIFGIGGAAMANTITFSFDPRDLPDNSNAAAIGIYMTGLYGSTVTVTGHDGPTSHAGLFTLLGGFRDGYVESESGILGGNHLIQINFDVTPITSVSFDWGQIADEFNADYLIGTTWTNFFHNDISLLARKGTFSTTFALPVEALRFHDHATGEVGIDNLVVTPVPEPTSLFLLGLGVAALGLVVRNRRTKSDMS